jgi:hypothetical protein
MMGEFEDPYRLRSACYWGLAAMARRASAMGRSITGTTIDDARSCMPDRVNYVYRGTGTDTLTPWMDELPDDPGRLTRRAERMAALAELPLWHGYGPVPPPGYITARQAAEQLGVDVRTVERYKRELASGRTG